MRRINRCRLYSNNSKILLDFVDLSSVVESSKLDGERTPMSHHLDLVRSGVASIETELQQRASLLAMDNANLRTQLEQLQQELLHVRGRLTDAENKCRQYAKANQGIQNVEKENKSLKDTLKYLQQELVKAGKKPQH